MNATFEGRTKNTLEDAFRKDANQLLGVRNWKLIEDQKEVWSRKLREAWA